MKVIEIAKTVVAKRSELPAEHAMLVGISGIDGSGKGYLTTQLADRLIDHNVAVLNIDGWLNLPHIRFDPVKPAENFYQNALRLNEMFERLVLPLKLNRSVDITMRFTDETASAYRPHRYSLENIDIILLEGIYLFKPEYRDLFDLKIWVECSFETALKRAISRSQEGLPAEETIKAYETIYFPAQHLHFEKDDPKRAADIIILNDDLLGQPDPSH